jgi:hypothetical protein
MWLDSVLRVDRVLQSETTIISLSGSTVSFNVNGSHYRIDVPDGVILIAPTIADVSSRFDDTTKSWVTRVPSSACGGEVAQDSGHGDDQQGRCSIFLTGVSVAVSTGLPGGVAPVTWQGLVAANRPNVTVSWLWAATAYTSLGSDYNALGVKAITHGGEEDEESDVAGTLENFARFQTGGGTAGRFSVPVTIPF